MISLSRSRPKKNPQIVFGVRLQAFVGAEVGREIAHGGSSLGSGSFLPQTFHELVDVDVVDLHLPRPPQLFLELRWAVLDCPGDQIFRRRGHQAPAPGKLLRFLSTTRRFQSPRPYPMKRKCRMRKYRMKIAGTAFWPVIRAKKST